MYIRAACRLFAATIFIAQASLVFSDPDDETELKLLFLVWRHGNRYPLQTLPNDPHKNEMFGTGHLDNEGKLKMYELGGYLRDRYSDFLGTEMKPDTAVLRTTAIPRTHTSAQLVMAGLFPPVPSQMWGPGLGQIWQPVSLEYFPAGLDSILTPYQSHCRALKRTWEAGQRRLQATYFNDTDLYEFLTRETGKPIKTVGDVYSVYETLKYEESVGLTLPEWANEVYPHRLMESDRIVGEIIADTEQAKRLGGGRFLYTLLNWVVAFKNGELPPNRLMFGYSAHDITLASIMGAMDMGPEHQLPFGTLIMYELREDLATHKLGFQIFLRNSSQLPAYQLEVPGCGAFCPVETMFQLFGKRLVPTYRQWIEECQRLDWLDETN